MPKRAGAKKVKTTEERMAVIETEVTYIKESIIRVEASLRTLTDNHLAHLQTKVDEIRDENTKNIATLEDTVRNMQAFCEKVQLKKKYGLQGRDKAIVIAGFLTAIGAIVIELIKAI